MLTQAASRSSMSVRARAVPSASAAMVVRTSTTGPCADEVTISLVLSAIPLVLLSAGLVVRGCTRDRDALFSHGEGREKGFSSERIGGERRSPAAAGGGVSAALHRRR